jgi:hypothetical protein
MGHHFSFATAFCWPRPKQRVMALIPTVANTDALKIISMEINPLTGTRVQRALDQGLSWAPTVSR